MDKNIYDKKNLTLYIKKIVICTISVIFLGFSISMTTKAMLGNDPITVFYDGLGISTKINMGIAANIINCILAFVVFLVDRHYIHIGTIIYAITLGLSITLGLNLYELLNIPNDLIYRILVAVMGYCLAFVSLGSYVAIDIGIDPWTAAAIIASKKINKSFGKTKAFIDTSVLIIGYLLGGTVGIMTLVAAIVGGPAIQKVSEFLDKVFSKVIKCKS